MWMYIIIGAFFIILGLAVHVGKLYFLLSGYNTMRRDKKANVDVRKIARLVGIYSYINGGLFLLMGVLDAAGMEPPMMPVFIFLMLSSVALAVMSQRYDYNLFDESGRLRKGAGKKLVIPIAIMVATMVFVGVLMFLSAQETEVSFLDEELEIHGMYGMYTLGKEDGLRLSGGFYLILRPDQWVLRSDPNERQFRTQILGVSCLWC